MKTLPPTCLRQLFALTLTAALFFSGQLLRAQTASGRSQRSPIAQPQQAMPPDDPDAR